MASAATSSWDKFVLLLWKNWTIQRRHYLQTAFEVLVPVLCCSFLLLIRGVVKLRHVQSSTVFNPLSTDVLSRFKLPSDVQILLAYSPQNPILEGVVSRAAESLNITYRGYPNAVSLESTLMNSSILAGVEFEDDLTFIDKLPDKLNVAIRFPSKLRTSMENSLPNWETRLLQFPFTPELREISLDAGGYPEYYYEGFLSVQSAISKAIIEEFNANVYLPKVYVNRFPYPPHYDDGILRVLESWLPYIMLFTFFYPCVVMIKHITVEKEHQLKESMKIMGLSGGLQWSAWFVKNMLLLVLSISMITALLCVPLVNNIPILKHSDWTAIWFFLFVYSVATVCFCFMMSVFFDKASVAARVAGFVWILSIVPYKLALPIYDSLSIGIKSSLNILSNSAMSFGIRSIIRLEVLERGLQWNDFSTPATIDEELNVGLVIAMLLVDALIYLIIAIYVEQVMPGEFGIAKPWYFPFSFKCRSSASKTPTSQSQKSDFIESDPSSSPVGIQIRNLRKVYPGNKTAVNGLVLNMYEDQITVLLGHNGAGKTTTMSMLTGMIAPTSGTAYLNGHDVRTEIEGVRRSLGICPQHNVLFDELTVEEHLRFFARLKGIPKNCLHEEINKYLVMLELTDKRNAQSHTLSGGMKRRLAVGVALCGGSKVVLLDEPTSGLDPSARRSLWDLLQQEKKHRTILLTTPFMDEADVLGDRIAIMSDGVLKAVGSPFFLKKNFGAGYRLICVKGPRCDKQQVLNILRRFIPDVRIATDIGSELSFVLNESYVQVFQPMLEDLEGRMRECGVNSYGISLTTMEEVFMKAGSDISQGRKRSNEIPIETAPEKYSLNKLELYTGRQLLLSQVKGQFLKKYLSSLRSHILLITQLVVPIVFAIVASNKDTLEYRNLPPLTMSFEPYKETVTVVGGSLDNSYLIQAYEKLFDKIDGRHHLKLISSNMNEFMLQTSIDSIYEVNTQYMAGATFHYNNYTAWFNNKGYHTAPLALSLLYSAVLASECPTCELTITNKPLPYPPNVQENLLESVIGYSMIINTAFAMVFVSSLYIMFYIKERTIRARMLQYVSGTNVTLYWTVAFIWDYFTFLVTCVIYIVVLAVFQKSSAFIELGQVLLLLMFYGLGFLPLTYLCTFVFNNTSSGYGFIMLFNITTGVVFYAIGELLRLPTIDQEDLADDLEWAFLLFPSFALFQGLENMDVIVSGVMDCRNDCNFIAGCTLDTACDWTPTCCDLPELYSFREVGIARNLLYLLVVGITAFVAVLLIEYRVLSKVKQCVTWKKKPRLSADEDSEVTAEKERVQNMRKSDIRNYNLVMRNATKYYGNFPAVNNLSVAIDRFECFGLLGINGAGKTTTFKMLIGDETFSSGVAWVEGTRLKSPMNTVHQRIGYCPQFDALLGNLTGRETLTIFALLRGVPRDDIQNVSLSLAEDLHFLKHLDKKIKEYSGGNKRKLSAAIALMGNPSIVYLDEPTTGMDPGAKRQLWDVICKVRSSGKSIVLTSHSMEECEALCTRLAIMVNGEFKCLGSTQHLKNKFVKGFLLTIKVKRADDQQEQRVARAKSFVEDTFDGAVLKEQYQDSLSYHVPQADLKWSAMFGLMESHKEQLEVEDYSLGQAALEQVFLHFTKHQRVED
ncbi:ATP-binding cassette sub-family A member 3 [Culex quinquefasciatus]|uniref:ATP-binding cassette sub-family A member 3 n=1 Tax=Culex quinquefasciatus TaxID=7176 RepID=B0WD35_CULQU|nr:ATP-binding cassette sub-family A member 3 [Culex quinquefasciatus]|eukprot:XP_001846619.1 ATP-binding cassette sub-family A member 3 [Culex quinquefasciatus]